MKTITLPARVKRVERGVTLGHEKDPEINDKPTSVYELVTRQMLVDLKDDIIEVKGRVNALFWLMLGAVFVEVVMRIAGA